VSQLDAVKAWIAQDPDASTRAELENLVDEPTPAARAELADRFAGRLKFGTAGLRGAVGAGPNRMNRAVVRAATAALAGWLLSNRPGAQDAGVAIGCDARHGSAEFVDEATAVLTGAGIRVHLLPRSQPTPLLAYSVRWLGASAGIMITASHNPREDNGYKLYLGDGAQIVPPVDAEIEAAIAGLGPLSSVPLGDLDGPLVTRHGDDVIEAYLGAVAAVSPAPAGLGGSIRAVYTPLHGVACDLFLAALRSAGFAPPHVVAAQRQPDPDFPTVTFPNPEEPGALDLAIADARRLDADLVLANDPDGDRLAVVLPDASVEGGWRPLTGDQLGALLGAHLLERSAHDDDPGNRLVATTVVSSSMLSKMAAAAGVRFAETLTGFKWIVRAGDALPGSRFIFGYEEALGYSVGDVVRDKDGIGAALATLALAATTRAQGASLLDRWDALEMLHGVHRTAQLSLRQASPDDSMAALRAHPLRELAGWSVSESIDLAGGSGALPPSDVLIYRLGASPTGAGGGGASAGAGAGGTGGASAGVAGGAASAGAVAAGGTAGDAASAGAVAAGGAAGTPVDSSSARLVVRPSGTEPKLKAYLEVVRAVGLNGDLAAARRTAGEQLDRLRAAVAITLGA
jgi:phosphomannomutase